MTWISSKCRTELYYWNLYYSEKAKGISLKLVGIVFSKLSSIKCLIKNKKEGFYVLL